MKMGNRKTVNQAKYDAGNTRHYHLKLNNGTDADIIDRLDKEPSMQGYIRRLIRDDIARGNAAKTFEPVIDPETRLAFCAENGYLINAEIAKAIREALNAPGAGWTVTISADGKIFTAPEENQVALIRYTEEEAADPDGIMERDVPAAFLMTYLQNAAKSFQK